MPASILVSSRRSRSLSSKGRLVELLAYKDNGHLISEQTSTRGSLPRSSFSMISTGGADVRASRRRLLRAGLTAPVAVALAGRPSLAACAPGVDARQDQRIPELVA